MPRRRAFTFAAFDVHVQPSLRRAFPVIEAPDRSFAHQLDVRLQALARVFDRKASLGRPTASA